MFIASSRSRGDKHKTRGPELTHQKVQSGPLDLYVKCEGGHKIWTFNYIFTNYAADAIKPFVLQESNKVTNTRQKMSSFFTNY